MATPTRTNGRTLATNDALSIAAAERAKRAAAAPAPTAPTSDKQLTLAQRARLAAGMPARNGGKPLSADEAARRERCKRSRSIKRAWERALAASTDDDNEADVRAYWADYCERNAQRYDDALQQLADERKR